MATCKQCGMAVIGNARRCVKCGAALVESASPALQAAVKAMEPPPPPQPARPLPWGRIAIAVIVVALLVAAVLWIQVQNARTEALPYLPLEAGRTWTFRSMTETDVTYKAKLVPADSAWDVQVTRMQGETSSGLGSGRLALKLRTFDLISVEPGTNVYNVPMVRFPLRSGQTWNYEYKESFASVRYIGQFEIVHQDETMQVPAGTFQTVHIRASFGQKALGTQLELHYWLAQGRGPIRFDIKVPSQFLNLHPLQLELAE